MNRRRFIATTLGALSAAAVAPKLLDAATAIGAPKLSTLPQTFGLRAGDVVTIEADPSYQFRLGEGMKALDRSAAAHSLAFHRDAFAMTMEPLGARVSSA